MRINAFVNFGTRPLTRTKIPTFEVMFNFFKPRNKLYFDMCNSFVYANENCLF
jgi:hypothetical protein